MHCRLNYDVFDELSGGIETRRWPATNGCFMLSFLFSDLLTVTSLHIKSGSQPN